MRLAEYTEKMKAEMAEKEANYADIDATVEIAANIEYESEEDEGEVHPDYIKGDDGVRKPENGYNPDVLVHRFYGAVEIDRNISGKNHCYREWSCTKE